ncbi:MAG: hypothetical protein M3008_05945 [Chloroflexota bacterium]|nr:hypothetical protein [Chloroflexota bacterium]
MGDGRRTTTESTQQEQQSWSQHAPGNLSPAKRADSLIATYIEPHPGSPGIAEYRLRVEENGYPVWTIIGHLLGDGENIERIVWDYQVSREAVDAARLL